MADDPEVPCPTDLWDTSRGFLPVIFIVVKHPVRPEDADAWPTLVEEFTSATRAEPGNISFDWYRSPEDPNLWLLVEAFRDGEAGKAHVESDHFKAAIDALPCGSVMSRRSFTSRFPAKVGLE